MRKLLCVSYISSTKCLSIYDRSEEDNDPMTDDAASTISLNVSRNQQIPSSPLANTRGGARQAAPSRTRHNHLSGVISSDDGVDSPTYDGDIETSTSVRTVHHSHPHSSLESGHSSASASVSTLTSPTSAHFPGVTAAEARGQIITPAVTVTAASRQNSGTTSGRPQQSQPVNVAAVPLRASEEPPPVPVAAAEFDPAKLTIEDIQEFVRKAIAGDPTEAGLKRPYKINPPPTGRPVRVYADGVYDLFHFGHALQLRQGKHAFPSVYLLVGVNSDELVQKHKSRTVMTHAERCEAVRHCRWVDEVVQDAPWIIDAAFLDKWEIDYVAHDEDPYAAPGHDDVYGYVKSLGKFLPTRRTPGVSTSELLERIVSGYRKREFDAKLEKIGAGELKAEGSDFDDSPAGSRPPSRAARAVKLPSTVVHAAPPATR
ncbi:uncharacterized protein FOMMEDRAFT_18648 [Fomitiporia mediterranea MF3/22]|uniref:uncharacterized protein n=1 Tax=Fomitiporia mediterranea (strain MF3/22) TaxID=694068 RepID=UPI000440755C|nr:uncharacterized protein FOMMEDRAFT_18648 [Fomitiporia mediterranea MF3/22]EJD04957.1 hypothetical protein FOMMEDRAFT_18648 [Fomitiporia mediterranea MF3/22]